MAGSIGPLGKPLEPLGNISFDEARGRLPRAGARGSLEGGVDLFVIETMPVARPGQGRASRRCASWSPLPIVVSLTFNEEGTTFYGDRPEDVVRELEALDVAVVGANCSQGPQPMLETVQRMAAVGARG